MNWLEFIASIVGSIAWPVAIAIVALIFKKPIQKLLPRITDFELWGSRAKFANELKEAEKTAEKIPATTEAARTEAVAKPDDPYLELAERFPEAAVLDSFKRVEEVFHEYMQEFGIKHPVSNRVMLEMLINEGFVTKEVYDLYRRVAETRNIAVHVSNKTISSGEAIAYRDLCIRLSELLRDGLVARTKAKHAAIDATQSNSK